MLLEGCISGQPLRAHRHATLPHGQLWAWTPGGTVDCVVSSAAGRPTGTSPLPLAARPCGEASVIQLNKWGEPGLS